MKRKKLMKLLFKYFNIKCDEIQNIIIDSRKASKNDLFIAIRGGNSFVENALELGAYVIYDDETLEIRDKKALLVKDSIKFIQDLAKEYRTQISAKVIAITGSNGKTTTKDIIHELLGTTLKGKKTEGNFNNHIGLPISLLRAEDDDEYLVLEMGMSGFGEIQLLSEICCPDYALITNIGDSHLEYLSNRENVFKAKTEVIPYVKNTLIVNGDDEFLKNLSALKVGKTEGNILKILSIKHNDKKSEFEIEYKDQIYKLKSNLIGEHNIYNICMSLLLLEVFKIKIEDIKEKLESLQITSMRFELIETEGKIYINDAYNASPVSMKFAIETFSSIYNDRYKIAVLGDMLELGEDSVKMHEQLEEVIFNTNIDELYLYGSIMKNLYNKLIGKKGVFYFETKDSIKKKILEKEENIAILLKGSRGMQLEKIITSKEGE